MKLIFLGAPGAGKGTQAEIISQRLNIPTISTGNMLRSAAKDGNPVGVESKKYMDAGKLVPDEFVIDLVSERLAESDCANGFILDGMPRTIIQAEELEEAGIHFDAVISIEISDDVIVERMAGRRACTTCGATYHVTSAPPKVEGKCDKCGSDLVLRDDDKPETVKHRLEVYHTKTEPLKDYYAKRGNLKPVNNQPTIEATTEEILKALGI